MRPCECNTQEGLYKLGSFTYALGTRMELWFGHGCSGDRVLFEHERNYVLGCFGYGCCGDRMLLEHEQNYALDMDTLVTVCSWNKSGIMVWARMLWLPHVLEHKRYCALGLNALFIGIEHGHCHCMATNASKSTTLSRPYSRHLAKTTELIGFRYRVRRAIQDLPSSLHHLQTPGSRTTAHQITKPRKNSLV